MANGDTRDDLVSELQREYAEIFPAPRQETVELGRVRDYLLALDEPADIAAGDPVPPLFLLTLGRTRRPQPTRGGAAKVGDQHEFLAPVHVGDVITVDSRVASIEEKRGRMGRTFRRTLEWTFTNQRGEAVGRGKTISLYWGR